VEVLLQTYFADAGEGGLKVAWSLCIEASFYLLLPAYAWAVRVRIAGSRSRRFNTEIGALLALGAVAIVVHELLARSSSPGLVQTLPGTFYLFVPGMALALISVRYDEEGFLARPIALVKRWPGAFVAAAVLALVLISFAPSLGGGGSSDPSYTIVALMLLLPCVFADSNGSRTGRIFSVGALPWLGLVSYGVYLWQVTAVDQLHTIDDGSIAGLLALIASSAAVSVGLAALSYYLLEQRFLRLKFRAPT
jgi:peptidoglycan/LPS O-acetylase OafA/YrhL